MAHLDFPAQPAPGDKYPVTPGPGQVQYTWDGEKWMTYSMPGAQQGPVGPVGPVGPQGPQGVQGPVGPGSTLPGPGTPIFSDTPPVGAADNSIWVEGDTGLMFFRWNDGNSTQWVALGTGSGNAVLFTPQALTSAQAAQARANMWVTKKNYVVNGAMQISQENGATAGTVTNFYPVDQFYAGFNGSGITCSTQQVASFTPAGSPNRVRVTVTAAKPTLVTNDYYMLIQFLEGLRIADLRSGSAAAKTVTIQFGVKAPAGTYTVNIQNYNSSRSYSAEYVIAAGEANTDVIKSVVIPLDTGGTWQADTTMSLRINWNLACAANFMQAPGSWVTGNLIASSNQFNMFAVNGNVFELFDVSMTEGLVAPPFAVPDYATEIKVCKRYYQKMQHVGMIGYSVNYAGYTQTWHEMRIAPTMSVTGNSASNCGPITFSSVGTSAARIYWTITAQGYYDNSNGVLVLNART